MLRRRIEKDLAEWYAREERKPLILRGARQVGKTTVIRKFAKTFSQFIYLNLEKRDDREIFSENLPFKKLLEGIYFLKNADLQEQSTLLCIDEIQNSPEAIAYLRFFYEEAPELPVVCAGSLLEVYIDTYSVSFPVGRVEYLYLFPLDFEEFLDNLDTTKPLEAYRQLPVPSYAHSTLMEYFHEYAMIGGMPEVCENYLNHGDVKRLERIYEGLLTSYIDDAAKYSSGPSSYQSLRHVIESAANETGTRIKFQGFGNSSYRSREMGEALRTLERAMFLYLLYPTTGTSLPALPDRKKSPRLQFIDIGLLNYSAGVQGHYIGLDDLNSLYRGKLVEQIVGQEVLARNAGKLEKPRFWVREKSGSSAEVDFVYPFEGSLYPIETKAGKTGTLRSLHEFMDTSQLSVAFRLYAGKERTDTVNTRLGKSFTLCSLPYYLAGRIEAFIEGISGAD